MNDWIAKEARRLVAEQEALVEADLLTIPGVHSEMTQAEAEPLGLSIIWQHAPDYGFVHYRGIAQHGELIIDHFPEWPYVSGGAATLNGHG